MTQKIPLPQNGDSIKEYDTFQTAEIQKVTAQLAQTGGEINKINTDKISRGEVTVADINKNAGKFDQSYMSDEFIGQFVENTQPINPVPAKRSVTSEYLADGAVTRSKTSYNKNVSTNLFDKDEANFSGLYSSIDGVFSTTAGYGSSAFIPVYSGKTYVISNTGHVAYWDNVGEFISGVGGETVLTPPSNATAMTVGFSIDNVDSFIIAEGSILPPYEKPKYKDDNFVIQPSQIEGNIPSYKLDTVPKEKLGIIEIVTSENLFDKMKVNKTGLYDSETGEFVPNSNYWASGFIEVEEGKTYVHRRTGHVTFWDEAKNYVSGLSGEESNPLTVPNGVKYVVFTILNKEIDEDMFVEGSVFPSTYIPYQVQYNLSESIRVKSVGSDLNGLTWNVLGDSITSALGANTPYHKVIGQKHGMVVNNYGISGSRIAVWEGSDDPMSVRYDSMSDNADIITVFGGTNDYGNNVTMGDINSTDTGTFYGSLNVLCLGLIEKYPGKRIGFITPMHRRNPDYAKMKQYVDAIKEVCGKYSIPVLDMWNGGGLYSSEDTINSTFFYNADGLHPNNEGHKVIARRIESFVKSL